MTRPKNNPSAQRGRSIFDDASRIFEGDRTMWIIYAVLIILGVLVGLSSMIRFLLSASAQIERLEKEHAQKEKK